MSDHNFNTPPELLERVRLLDRRGIGLDPCSNAHTLVDARVAWEEADNGLGRGWRGYGLVFMNPPHSMSPYNIEPWMEHAHTDFVGSDYLLTLRTYREDQFVGLIPAKPDTAWFHDWAVQFPVKCFLRGRPKFWLGGQPMPGPGKFASMLIYAGPKRQQFCEIFDDLGWIVSSIG